MEKPQASLAAVRALPHPEEEKTRLVLADGTVIFPDEKKDGVLYRSGNSEIRKQGNKVFFGVSRPAQDRTVSEAGTNLLTTPRGRQYEVVLSDGSQVWLNTGSSLRFPAVFSGGERRVAMTGEAYFEIAKEKARPFRVLLPRQQGNGGHNP